jgi:hypothetical protein
VAAVIMLALDEPPDEFVAAYAQRLEGAGFTLRKSTNPMLPTDRAYARYEATNSAQSRYVFVALRQTSADWFAQLTFWDAPVPRVLP